MEYAGWYPASGGYSANFTSLTTSGNNMWAYDTPLMGPWGEDVSKNSTNVWAYDTPHMGRGQRM